MRHKALYFLVVGCVLLLAAAWMGWPGAEKQASDGSRSGRAARWRAVPAEVRPEAAHGAVVRGKVCLPDGAPIPGAAVYHQSPSGGWRKLARPSDESGAFSLLVTDPGIHAFYAREGYLFSFTHPDAVTRIAVEGHNHPDIPVTLTMVPAVHWTVTVLEETNRRPIAGAEVRLPRLLGRSVFTDTDGHAEFNLPRRLRQIQVLARGFEPRTLQLGYRPEDRAAFYITMKRGAHLAGEVVDPQGNPLAGTVVTLVHQDLSQRVFTDHEGGFVLSSLPGGLFGDLHFQKQGFRNRHMRGLRWPGAEARNTALGGEPAPIPMRIVLVPEDRPMTEVTGVVQDMFLRPIADARVSFRTHREASFYHADADARGRFTLETAPLDPDRGYQLLVRAKGHAPKLLPFQLGRPGRAIEVRPMLDLGQAVSGLITDADGRAVAGALVTAHLDLEGTTFQDTATMTDAEGRFFLDDLSGKVGLEVHAPGFLGELRALDLEAADTQRIVLSPEGILQGYVRDARTGSPVTHFRMGLQVDGLVGRYPDLDALARDVLFSHEEGYFRLPAPPPGTPCRLRIEAEGYPPMDVTQVSGGAGDIPPVVSLSREGVSLTGTVTAADGPAVGARVTAVMLHHDSRFAFPWDAYFKGVTRDMVLQRTVYADDAGRFQIDNLPAQGDLELVVEQAGKAVTALQGLSPARRAKPLTVHLEEEVVCDITINRERFPDVVQLQVRGLMEPRIERSFLLAAGEDHVRLDKLGGGVFAVELFSFDDRGEADQACVEMVEVQAGAVEHVALGFAPAYQVSGTVQVPGAEGGDRLFLLPQEEGMQRFSAVADGQGYFSFKQVPAGDYDLLYLSAAPFHPHDFAGILEEHPNRVPVSVFEDVSVTPRFRRLSSVSGCVGTEALDWRFYLSGRDRAGTSYYREALADKNGCFRVNHLPPGTYRLGADIDGRDLTLVSVIRTPDEGSDLDLGPIAAVEPGSLTVHTGDAAAWPGVLTVSVYPDALDGAARPNPIAVSAQPRPMEQLTLEALPPGPVWVRADLAHDAAVAWPEKQLCRILPGVAGRVDISLVPVTRLDADFGSLRGQITAVRLVRDRDGMTLTADACETLPGRPRNLQLAACFSERGLAAHNLPSGPWHVELSTSGGAVRRARVDLVPGSVTRFSF